MRVGLAKSLQFGRYRSNIELFLQFTAAVFERLVVKEDDIWLGELLARLAGDADVDVFVEGGAYKAYFVGADDLKKLLLGAGEVSWVALAALKADLDAIVIFEEFNLVDCRAAVLLNLLEEVLAVEPHHLHRVELDPYPTTLLLRHNLQLYYYSPKQT